MSFWLFLYQGSVLVIRVVHIEIENCITKQIQGEVDDINPMNQSQTGFSLEEHFVMPLLQPVHCAVQCTVMQRKLEITKFY